MAPELLVLALEFYRAPLRFRPLADPKARLPPSFDRLFGDLGAALGASRIADTAAELGITEQELAQAALFLVRNVMLAPGSDHYRILGLSRDASAEAVRRHYLILAGLLHPDRYPGVEAEQNRELLVRVNLAYDSLRSAEARQRYDAILPRQGQPTRWVWPATVPTARAYTGTERHPRGARAARPRLGFGLIAIGVVAGVALILVFASPSLHGPTAKRPLVASWDPPQLASSSEAVLASGSWPPVPTTPHGEQGANNGAPPELEPGPVTRLDDAQPAQFPRPGWFTGALE
jgi:hypothetical protein